MKSGTKKLIYIILAILGYIAVVLGVYVYRLHSFDFASAPDDFSTFGDYVGGVSGGIAGLISIIFLYLTYTKQIEIFEQQKKDSDLLQFEQNFWHLLEEFRQVSNELRSRDDKIKGHSYIRMFRDKIESAIDEKVCNEKDSFDDINALPTRQRIDNVYQELFRQYADEMGHYFRTLYHLLKYIDEGNKSNAKKYIDLVQAQMSTDELYITCINGISSYGRKKLFPLLNNYSFLENLAADADENTKKIVYFYYRKTLRKNVTGVRRNTILVGGVIGTPKAELSKRILAEHLPVRVTSVQSMLIRANRDSFDISASFDTLRDMMQKTIDPDDVYIINCNFCQLERDGTRDRVPVSVYQDLNLIAVILLETDFPHVANSIKDSPMKSKADSTSIEIYMEDEDTYASDFAGMKNVPFFRMDANDMEKVMEKVRELVKQYS